MEEILLNLSHILIKLLFSAPHFGVQKSSEDKLCLI